MFYSGFGHRSKRCLLSIYIAAIFLIPLRAQFFSTGEDPAFIRWEQINTTHFTIVFPSTFEKEANHLASVMDYIFNNVHQSYHHTPKKNNCHPAYLCFPFQRTGDVGSQADGIVYNPAARCLCPGLA